MPNIVARFIHLGPKRAHTLFGLTSGQENESLVNISDVSENTHTYSIFNDDSVIPIIVQGFIRLGKERPHTPFELTSCQENESLVNVSD